MIVKFARDGTSAKGLINYLTHDAGHAKTSERVAWTHMFNLVNQNHIPSAVHEIVTTYMNADLLRAEAGISGSKPTKSIKHVSLNWHRSETVEKAEMVRAASDFLKAMGWADRQCVVVCHEEPGKHPHLHLAISKVCPDTGKSLDEGFCYRRAQRWALGYEQSRGAVLCTQRLRRPEEREPAPPRPVWELLEKGWQAHLRAETARMVDAPEAEFARRVTENLEWKILREL